MKKHRIRIIIYGIIISSALLYQFGRPLWHPVYVKVMGKKTTVEVYNEIGEEIEKIWLKRFLDAKLKYQPEKICLIALKNEKSLEVWSNDHQGKKLIHKFPFMGFSGALGPKLKSGDLQIPEGIYKTTFLNANSSYHLSIKINYPNAFDREKAKLDKRTNLGGDIFIHGKTVTIGCIPIGDKAIEELFILVYKIGLSNTKVIITPNDLRIAKPMIENNQLSWLTEKLARIQAEMDLYR